MSDRDELTTLLKRVKAATGSDRELDSLLLCALIAPVGSKVEQSPFNGAWCIYEPRAYGKTPFHLWERTPQEFKTGSVSGSIDAALALTERLLPGWWWLREDGQSIRLVGPDNGDCYPSATGKHHIVPLAILSALLTALIAQVTP